MVVTPDPVPMNILRLLTRILRGHSPLTKVLITIIALAVIGAGIVHWHHLATSAGKIAEWVRNASGSRRTKLILATTDRGDPVPNLYGYMAVTAPDRLYFGREGTLAVSESHWGMELHIYDATNNRLLDSIIITPISDQRVIIRAGKLQ